MQSEPTNKILNHLAKEIVEKSSNFNLTGYKEADKLFQEQFDDCIKAFETCKHLIPHRLVDVGSGAGIPGLVWAIVYKIEVISIDSNAKKIRFQEAFIKKHKLQNITTMHKRAEEINFSKKDTVVCKAFSSIAKTIKLLDKRNLPGKILFIKKNDEKTKEEILEAKPLLYHYKIHPYKSNLGDMCVVEAYDSKNSNH